MNTEPESEIPNTPNLRLVQFNQTKESLINLRARRQISIPRLHIVVEGHRSPFRGL